MIYAWDNQLRYALALVADLTDEQFVLRPGGNMNHPAWILGHVAMYHPVTVQLLGRRAGRRSEERSAVWVRGTWGRSTTSRRMGASRRSCRGLRKGMKRWRRLCCPLSRKRFSQPPSLERWAKMYPTVEFMLPDLLIFHESMHIGQISIWRRAAGLAGRAVSGSDAAGRPFGTTDNERARCDDHDCRCRADVPGARSSRSRDGRCLCERSVGRRAAAGGRCARAAGAGLREHPTTVILLGVRRHATGGHRRVLSRLLDVLGPAAA